MKRSTRPKEDRPPEPVLLSTVKYDHLDTPDFFLPNNQQIPQASPGHTEGVTKGLTKRGYGRLCTEPCVLKHQKTIYTEGGIGPVCIGQSPGTRVPMLDDTGDTENKERGLHRTGVPMNNHPEFVLFHHYRATPKKDTLTRRHSGSSQAPSSTSRSGTVKTPSTVVESTEKTLHPLILIRRDGSRYFYKVHRLGSCHRTQTYRSNPPIPSS